MREVKSGEYLIANGTGAQDRYLFTKNLGNDVACIIRMTEETAAIARQVSEEDFAAMWKDLIEITKRFSTKKPEFHVALVGGNDYDEPNSATLQYVDKLILYMLTNLLNITQEQEIPSVNNNSTLILEGNDLHIKLRPLYLGKVSHPNSVIVNAISDILCQNYDQWEKERHFGCSTEEDKRKSVEIYIEQEWQSHLSAIKSMEENRQRILARRRLRREQAQLSGTAQTTSGEKRSAAIFNEKSTLTLSASKEPNLYKPVLLSSETLINDPSSIFDIDKKARMNIIE